MNSLTPKEMYASYKALSEKFLSECNYEKVVTVKDQAKEIELLKDTIHYERFFFTLDLHELKINNVHGVGKWLGYADKDFSLMKFLDIIHPAHVAAHHITATVLIEGLMRGDWNIEFMKHRYITNIALRHNKGHYLLLKRLASIFQYDKNHRLLEYLNEFTIVGEYKEQPYSIRAGDNTGGTTLQWLEDFLKRIHQAFEQKHLFGFQELRILRKYAYHTDASVDFIANTFKIKDSTVITYNKRILEKAEALFHKKFDNAKQVAFLLREQGLV